MSEHNDPPGYKQAVSPVPRPEREWLSYVEAREIVSLSRGTLWKLVSAGEVEAARVGRAVRINRKSLEGYMKRSVGSDAETK